MKIRISIIIVVLALHTSLLSQVDSSAIAQDSTFTQELQVKAGRFGDDIIVRWAPTNPGTWLEGNRNGYRLERMIRDAGGPFDITQFETIYEAQVWDPETFSQAIEGDPTNSYLMIQAECIYGEMEVATLENMQNARDASDALNNKFAFALMSADLDGRAAQAAALRFTDRGVQLDRLYYYRVTLLNEEGEARVQSTTVIKSSAAPQIVPEISEIVAHEGRVELFWAREAHEEYFSAYHIERSRDGSTWNRLNLKPYVHALNRHEEYNPSIVYSDSIENYEKYSYRLIGLTPFGTESAPSPEVVGMARDKTPPAAAQDVTATYLEDVGVKLTWVLPEDTDVVSLVVGHSLYFSGPFARISESARPDLATEALHLNPDPYQINYYTVYTVDSAGNPTQSLVATAMIPDSMPPDAPTGIFSAIDSTGVVKIHWQGNDEEDLQGYQVYYGGSMRSNFTQITSGPIQDTFYIDTLPLETLTESAYYKVVAVDQRYNYSAFSRVAKVDRADVLPPSPPVFQSYQVNEDGIRLDWANSSSHDVTHHLLERRSSADTIWRTIQRFENLEKGHLDQDVMFNTNYQYRLVAFDQSNLSTPSPKVLRVRSKKASLSAPNCSVERSDDGVRIRWSTLPKGNLVIQKSLQNGPFVTIASVPVSQDAFVDVLWREDQQTKYRCKLVQMSVQSPYGRTFQL